MIRIVVVATLALAVPHRAEASCSSQQHCLDWLDPLMYAMGAAIVGGYVYGTGYFAYHDLTDDTQRLKYAGAEAAIHGGLAALWIGGTVSAIRHDHPGETIIYSTLGLVHTTLALHGAYGTIEHRGEFGHIDLPPHTGAWLVGIGYGTNTLLWAFAMPGEHSRNYGITEVAFNAPLALGLGALAIHDASSDGRTGSALLYGGMAVVSGALTLHGVKTILDPYEPPALDLMGTDVTPTVVTDGREVGPGLAAIGRW